MEAAATKWLDRLKKLAPAAWAGRVWPTPTWRARAPPPTVAGKPAQPPEMKPKLLKYDAQGNLLTLQEEQTKISTYEILNWRTWYEAPQLRESLDEEMAKSLLLVAVQRLFLDMPAPKGVDLVRRKGAVSCVATMEFEAGALQIAPVVTGKQYIVGKTTHPCAVHVQVPIGADKIVPLYIVPELKSPTPPSLTADVLVRDGEAALTDHEWARNHTACLFWTVQRGPKPAAATRGHGDSAPDDGTVNCSYSVVEVVHLVGIQATESVQPLTLHIPIVTNTQTIAPGDVLILPPTPPKPKPPPPSKARTWLTDVAKRLKAG